MACALTTGYTFQGCKVGIGGIKRVLITESANLATSTLTAGVYTAMTLSTGKQFREYLLDKEHGGFTDNGVVSIENNSKVYRPQIDFTIGGLSTTVRNEIDLVIQNNLLMIVESKAGVYWIFGMDGGMDLINDNNESGVKYEDFNGTKLTFVGGSGTRSKEISSSLITTLLAPAV
jgi:hypothetical protein